VPTLPGVTSPVEFVAEVWQWDARKSDSWFFLSLPPDLADDIDAEHGHRAKGFGSLRVEVRIGTTTWQTSIFPDTKQQTYVLPLKKSVRMTEAIENGVRAAVTLRVLV
jgi:hypothetical protein